MTDERIQKALASCRAFVTKVNTIVVEGTNLWVAEFQDSLNQLLEGVKAKLAPTMPGAVSSSSPIAIYAKVTGLSRSTTEIFEMVAARSQQLPAYFSGIQKIRVDGTISTKPVRAEKPVSVGARAVTSLELALS
jgi:hypothetical protein